MAVRIYLEIGHEASLRTKKTQEGFTHDWEVFVRGCDGAEISYYVEKVVFHLHETFPKPKRVVKEPPFSVKESGYAGFNLPIDIYLRNGNEPKKIRFNYDLHLQQSGPPIIKVQKEKYIFNAPNEEFKMKLLKGGALLGSSSSVQDVSDTRSSFDDKNQMINKPKLSGSDLVKKQKMRIGEPCRDFHELFGSPINMSKPPERIQIKPENKVEKQRTKHSPHKESHKDKERSKTEDKKNRDEKKQKEKAKDRERMKEKSMKKEKSPRPKSPSPKRPPSPRFSSPSPFKQKDKYEKKEKDKKKEKRREHKHEEHKDEQREKKREEIKKERSPTPKPIEKKEKSKEKSKDKDDKYKHKKKDKEKRERKEEKNYKPEKKPEPMKVPKMESHKKEKMFVPVAPTVPPPRIDDESSNSSTTSSGSSIVEKKPKEPPIKVKEEKKVKKDKGYQENKIKCKRKSISVEDEPPEKVHKDVINNNSDGEIKEAPPPPPPPPPAPDGLEEDYFGLLRDLQHKIMGLKDSADLQRVVKLIVETGRYEVSAHTFDFDLCLLDRSTVQQLQEFFASET